MIRKVLILGHTGFIGSRLETFFRTREPGLDLVGRSTAAVDLRNWEDVKSLAALCDLDTAVLMCAAIKRQCRDDLQAFSDNLQMTMNVCRMLQDRPVGRFVFFSSTAVYGEDVHNPRITEQTPVHPRSYYGMVKYASEYLFRKALEAHDKACRALLVLRPPLIYGPRDRGRTYGPSGFIMAALKGEPILLWGDGTERRDFVFIDDLLELVYRLTFGISDGILNIASGQSYTFREVTEIVFRLAGGEVPVTSRPRTKTKADHGFCTTALIRLVPGFSFTPLEEGIRRTVEAERQMLLAAR